VDQRPDVTPDQVKKLLTDTAQPLSGISQECQGAGLVDLKVARQAQTPKSNKAGQNFTPSNGTGSLDAARGSIYVESDGVPLRGEQDIMSAPWNGWVTTDCWQEGKGKDKTTVCGDVATTTLWDGGDWNGITWSGTTWSGTTWSGTTWSGTTWSGLSWSGTTWSDQAWTGTTWSGTTWSGTTWSGTTWSGISWSGQTWG
jgi:serine protease AprX